MPEVITDLNPRAAEAALKEYERITGSPVYNVGAFFAALREFKRIEAGHASAPEERTPPIDFPPERKNCNLKHWSPHA